MLFSCDPDENESKEDFVIEGLKPIYSQEDELVVVLKEAVQYENLGKIVYRQPYIFLNEQFKGIHVVDNSDPTRPEKIAFYGIPGNTDFTIKGDYIYANLLQDLVTIRVDDDNLEITNRIEDFYKLEDLSENLYPGNDYVGYFECVDLSLGIVTGWTSETLVNPNCRR